MFERCTPGVYIMLAAMVTSSLACGDDTPAAGSSTAGAASDPGSQAAGSSFPTDFQTLEEALADFSTVEACASELRNQTPAEVAEGIGELGYSGFVHDVCRSLEAAKTRDPSKCEDFAGAAIERGCLRRVAVLAEDPSMCPSATGLDGKEPRCLAWAMRNPRLCQASPDRALCEAVLSGDLELCADLADQAQPSCVFTVGRYEGILGDAEIPTPPRTRTPALSLAGEGLDFSRASLVEGVFASASGCNHELRLRPRNFIGQSDGIEVHLQLTHGASAPLTLSAPGLASIRITRPRGTPLSAESGTITIDEFSLERASAFRATVDVVLTPGDVALTGTITSYLRDFEPGECGL